MNRRRLLVLSSLILAAGPFAGLKAQDSAKPFTSEQLDQMLAPIALYPDALLAQVLMAATYPLEIVEAARWVQANPTLKGDAAVAAVKDKSWDVSVKSLVAFPQVLTTMSDKLEWTQKLGDAMIGQQKDVAESVQRLRARAQAAGNLKTTSQQKVTTQPAPSGGASAIIIEPASPEVIYVPYYNPAWAYGVWPYPAYPPYYYPPPPAYGYGTALMAGMMFGLGVAAGAAMFGGWHWGWSGGGWGNSYTSVNVNRAVNISGNNFNASRYANGQWSHDPAHRDGVPYRTQAERQEFGQTRMGTQQREQFRGQLENRGGEAANRPGGAGTMQRPEQPRAQQPRAEQPRAEQPRAEQPRSSWENRGGAFDGIDRGQSVNRDFEQGNRSWGDRGFGGGSFERGGFGGGRGGFGGRR
jgi:hypothetical protein